MNCGSGGGYPGGGGGGASDERNSGAAHDGGDGANGMVVVRYTLDEAPTADDFAYPSATDYPGKFVRDGSSGKGFHSAYEAEIAGKANGDCYFRNAYNVEKELYIHNFTSSSPANQGTSIATDSRGVYILIASNNWGTNSFPSGGETSQGNGKNQRQYQVDRNGDKTDTSHDGVASPNGDYIIGMFIHSLAYHRVKVYGWGRDATGDSSQTFPSNCPAMVDVTWQSGHIHQGRQRGNVTINATGGNGTLSTSANHFLGDGVYGDWQLNANTNQSTIGGIGCGSTTYGIGDCGSGNYLGHGSNEGEGEGWYDSAGNGDCRGYTTWVR